MGYYDERQDDNRPTYAGEGSRYSYTSVPETRYESTMSAKVEKKKKSGKVGKFFGKLFIIVASGLLFGLCAAVAFGLVNYYTDKEINNTKKVNSVDMDDYAEQIERRVMNKIANNHLSESAVIGATNENGNVVTVVTDVSDVVEEVMPSVVSIVNNYTITESDFWGRRYESSSEASGSGIIIGENDNEYLIATNNHVVDNSDELKVKFIDGEEAVANLKGADSGMDIAVIAVNKGDLNASTIDAITIAELGDSEELKVGEPAIAIGNALGYGQSVTTGVISALDRQLDMDSYGNKTDGFIQTDAAINPGNSGGALLNVRGQVVGINSSKIGGNAVEGMGYAIPISKALPIIDNLKTKKTKKEANPDSRGYLGISGRGVSQELAQMYAFPEGIYVYEVYPDTGAEKAGLRKGDIITKFEGSNVNSMEKLVEVMAYYTVGETVELTLERLDDSGAYTELTVQIELVDKSVLPTE